MKNLSLKSIETIGAVWSILAGSLLHFTFEISGENNFIALFSAVNESVWEHTKLIFFPIIFFMPLELYLIKKANRVLFAKVVESIFGILFIISFYYTYTGVFGHGSLTFDIGSFIAAVVFGKIISYWIIKRAKEPKYLPWLYAAVLLFFLVFFGMATFSPPKIPLFREGSTELYGVPK